MDMNGKVSTNLHQQLATLGVFFFISCDVYLYDDDCYLDNFYPDIYYDAVFVCNVKRILSPFELSAEGTKRDACYALPAVGRLWASKLKILALHISLDVGLVSPKEFF